MGCGASSAGDGGDGGGHRPVPSEFATLDIGVPPFSPKAVAEAAPGGVDETAGSGGGGGKVRDSGRSGRCMPRGEEQ
eukprot:364644-Chlamydomonas_euryale.AAC.1